MKRFTLLWQVLAGTAAIAVFTLGTIWLVRIVAPEPHNLPAPGGAPIASLPESTSTSVATLAPTSGPELSTYEWRGTIVYRSANFPQIPTEGGVYTHSADAPATIESARKLAERFGIHGDVYQDPSGLPGAHSFVVTDGKQRLTINSDGQFRYYSDFSTSFTELPVSTEIAASAIDTFLKAHGFDFAYQIQVAKGRGAGWFYVVPLTLDGRAVRFDFDQMQGLTVHVGPNGQIISLDADLLNVDSKPVGKFSLISAEDAWQKFLHDALPGMLQSEHGGGSDRLLWHRTYPDNQPVTLYGNSTSFTSAETGKPVFIAIDGYMAIGNTSGIEKLANNTFVMVKGQLFSENGIRKFKVDSWQRYDQARQQYLQGSLRRVGGKVFFTSQGTDYTLADAPTDLPASAENINISGMVNGTLLDWQDISYFENPGQGGGGGCGGSFAKLNLSGTLVPWPTPTPALTLTELPTGQHIENFRGMLSVTKYEQTDGSQLTEYDLSDPKVQYLLQGPGLEQLSAYHNRPITVWGTVTGYNQYREPILAVERFEIPFPNLKFQILRGTQKLTSVDGQQVTLFTAQDGTTYAQFMPVGNPDNNLTGVEGDLVQNEVLIIPDETFGGHPIMRVFSGGLTTDPKTGQLEEMKITADQPSVIPVSEPSNGPAITLTIDAIELAYYTPNPQYAESYPEAMTPYIQPVWRFSGHYSDGSQTEIMIQALKPDFLFPEAAPVVQCG